MRGEATAKSGRGPTKRILRQTEVLRHIFSYKKGGKVKRGEEKLMMGYKREDDRIAKRLAGDETGARDFLPRVLEGGPDIFER